MKICLQENALKYTAKLISSAFMLMHTTCEINLKVLLSVWVFLTVEKRHLILHELGFCYILPVNICLNIPVN